MNKPGTKNGDQNLRPASNVLHVQNTGEVGNGARPVSVGSAPNTRQRVGIPKVIIPCRRQPLSMLA